MVMRQLHRSYRWPAPWLTVFITLLLFFVTPTFANAPSEELDPNDFTKMDFDVAKLIEYHSAYPVPATTGHSRNAYVMIHYEGTPNDDLYVLGTQIVIRSIKETGTKQDVVIVCADNVRESSKRIFEKEGAKIKIVPNIPNPYKVRHLVYALTNTQQLMQRTCITRFVDIIRLLMISNNLIFI